MARRVNPRGRYLDRKYPRIQYRFDRWGWVRLQAAERVDELVREAATRATSARAAWEGVAAQAGSTWAGLREAGEQIAEPLEPLPAVRPADAQWS